MNELSIYLRIEEGSTKATVVDEWNQKMQSLPSITRGMQYFLKLYVLDSKGHCRNLAAENLSRFVFVIADDWNSSTPPQIMVQEGITVESDHFCIPIDNTNTIELIKALGNTENGNFGCELVAFRNSSNCPDFIVQFQITIQNRRSDAGTPNPTQITREIIDFAEVDTRNVPWITQQALEDAIQEALEGVTIGGGSGTLDPTIAANIQEHITDTNNPHHVTPSQIGAVEITYRGKYFGENWNLVGERMTIRTSPWNGEAIFQVGGLIFTRDGIQIMDSSNDQVYTLRIVNGNLQIQ